MGVIETAPAVEPDREMIKSAINQSIRLGSTRSCLIGAGLLSLSVAALGQTTGQTDDAQDGVKDLNVTVQSGDTLTGILSRELKSLDAWGEVAEYNKLVAPDKLAPGEVIVIPAEVLRRRNFATVVYVKGKAIHHNTKDETQEQVAKGTKIHIGDRIETDKDGFVSLSFNGESSVNIQPESSVQISVLKCIDQEIACEIILESDSGRLSVDVKNVGFEKPTIFSIDTPYASAAVRGTRFDFDVNNGNILGVTEGTVEISLNGNSNAVDIGKGVLAGEGRSINDLYDLLLKPEMRLSDDVNYVSSEDLISWNVIETAERYIVSYARSESLKDVVTSLTDTDNITKPELAPGDYYVGTRAVDSNGLRGFTARKKISSVTIDDTEEAPDLEILISESEMQVSAPDAVGVTEVRIGNRLVAVDSDSYMLSIDAHLLQPGQQISVPIDNKKDWYLQGRKVVGTGSVSPYGVLYHFEPSR